MVGYVPALCVVLLVIVASPSSHVQASDGFLAALEEYVEWMEDISHHFSKDTITLPKLQVYGKEGKERHAELLAQFQSKLDMESVKKHRSEAVIAVLESELKDQIITPKAMVGILFADSVQGSLNARLVMVTEVFDDLAVVFRQRLIEAKTELSTDIIKQIYFELTAAEIVFDVVEECFQGIVDANNKPNQVALTNESEVVHSRKKRRGGKFWKWVREHVKISISVGFSVELP